MNATPSLSPTTDRRAVLEAARDGREIPLRHRRIALAFERHGIVRWEIGGTFSLEPAGVALLESWTRRPERRTRKTTTPDVTTTSPSDRAPTEEHPE